MSEVLPIAITDESLTKHSRLASVASTNSLVGFLEASIFYSLLVVMCLAAIPYGTVEPWWKAAVEVAMFTLGLLWALHGALTGKWFEKQHRLLIPLLALVVFALIQITLPLRSAQESESANAVLRPISFSPYDTKMVALELLALVIAGGLSLKYAKKRRRLMTLAYVVIGIGVGSALFGFLRVAFQHRTGFLLPDLKPDDGTFERGVGFAQFINHNHFALLAEMSLGLTLGLMLRRPIKAARLVIGLMIAIPLWIATVYSGSRGGLATMLAQVLFLALLVFVAGPSRQLEQSVSRIDRAKHIGQLLVTRGVLIGAFLVVMVLGVVWVGGDPLAQHLESVPDEFEVKESDRFTRTYRSTIWPMTLQMFTDHPLAGTGFGAYWIAITRYHHGSGEMTPQEAHNDYLELLASGGLIGVALLIGFVLLFVREAIVSLRHSDASLYALRLGALAGIFAVGIHSVVDFGLHIVINGLLFVVLIVIATAKIDLPNAA